MLIAPLFAGSMNFATSAALPTLVGSVVGDFFTHVFLHPGQHTTAILAMAGVTVAIGIGTAFLIKLIYNRCCPDKIGSRST